MAIKNIPRAMSLCVGQAGSRVRSSRAATADRSGRGSLRTGSSSLYRSFDEQIKLPRGGLRRLAGGMTHLAEVTPHTLSAVVGCRVDGFFALLDPTDAPSDDTTRRAMVRLIRAAATTFRPAGNRSIATERRSRDPVEFD